MFVVVMMWMNVGMYDGGFVVCLKVVFVVCVVICGYSKKIVC